MLFKYMTDGKEIGSFIGKTMAEAKKEAEARGIDWETIDKYEEPKGDKMVEPESNVTYTLDEEPFKKNRKSRADKGQPRVKKDTKVTKKAIEKSRKKPEYFLYNRTTFELSEPLAHDKAITEIESCLSDNFRVIMGHEIKFVRKVQFKMS